MIQRLFLLSFWVAHACLSCRLFSTISHSNLQSIFPMKAILPRLFKHQILSDPQAAGELKAVDWREFWSMAMTSIQKLFLLVACGRITPQVRKVSKSRSLPCFRILVNEQFPRSLRITQDLVFKKTWKYCLHPKNWQKVRITFTLYIFWQSPSFSSLHSLLKFIVDSYSL